MGAVAIAGSLVNIANAHPVGTILRSVGHVFTITPCKGRPDILAWRSEAIVLGDSAPIAPACDVSSLVYRHDSQPGPTQFGIGQEITAFKTGNIGGHIDSIALNRSYSTWNRFDVSVAVIPVISPGPSSTGFCKSFMFAGLAVPAVISRCEHNGCAAIHCSLPGGDGIRVENLLMKFGSGGSRGFQEEVWKAKIIGGAGAV